ncbi:amino acid ABC transporter permease [Herbaspirillum sp. GCM10030257]|uniref:amino acid ABC transporter permease n=1 Tax=Herbaspirillum sp. GCM10030257 TaxID=3273393 RepID=UPI0036100DAE
MNYNWNWPIFLSMAPGAGYNYFQSLLLGTGWTLVTACLAFIIALFLGTAVGIGRTLPSRTIQWMANVYVEVFRNIPLLVQMFLWFFVFPELVSERLGQWLKTNEYSSFATAVVCLGIFTSARIAEQVRSGIRSLSNGQAKAALAIGLSLRQAYQLVLLPQALRLVIPPMTSEMVNIVKNTSVGLTIGLMELTARTREMQEMSFQVFEAFLAATIIYLVINTAIGYGMGRLERFYANKTKHTVLVDVANSNVQGVTA